MSYEEAYETLKQAKEYIEVLTLVGEVTPAIKKMIGIAEMAFRRKHYSKSMEYAHTAGSLARRRIERIAPYPKEKLSKE